MLQETYNRIKKIRHRIKKDWKGRVKDNIDLYIENNNVYINKHNGITMELNHKCK